MVIFASQITKKTMRRVFTVDDKETYIRDDGFHVEVLDDNLFEIGIHSVDCSDYVTLGRNEIAGALRNEKKRSKLLTQQQRENFSLTAGTQRRAISLILLLICIFS